MIIWKIIITGKGVKPFDLTPFYLAITWPICVYLYTRLPKIARAVKQSVSQIKIELVI